MDSLASDLFQLVSSLGRVELTDAKEEYYIIAEDGLEKITSLQKIIIADYQTFDRPISKLLHKWNFITDKIIPIIKSLPSCTQIFQEDDLHSQTLFRYLVKILVLLTSPVKKTESEEVNFYEFEKENQNRVRRIKNDLCDNEVLCILCAFFQRSILIANSDRDKNDHTIIDLTINLLCNLLKIPDIAPIGYSAGMTSTQNFQQLHLRFIESLDSVKLIDAVIYFTKNVFKHLSKKEKIIRMRLLEFIALLFVNQDPLTLIYDPSTSKNKSHPALPANILGFEEACKKEKEKKKQLVNHVAIAGRHPRFGGTYVIRNKDGSMVGSVPTLVQQVENQVRFQPSSLVLENVNVAVGKTKRKSVKLEAAVENPTNQTKARVYTKLKREMKITLCSLALTVIQELYSSILNSIQYEIDHALMNDYITEDDFQNFLYFQSFFTSFFYHYLLNKNYDPIFQEIKPKSYEMIEGKLQCVKSLLMAYKKPKPQKKDRKAKKQENNDLENPLDQLEAQLDQIGSEKRDESDKKSEKSSSSESESSDETDSENSLDLDDLIEKIKALSPDPSPKKDSATLASLEASSPMKISPVPPPKEGILDELDELEREFDEIAKEEEEEEELMVLEGDDDAPLPANTEPSHDHSQDMPSLPESISFREPESAFEPESSCCLVLDGTQEPPPSLLLEFDEAVEDPTPQPNIQNVGNQGTCEKEASLAEPPATQFDISFAPEEEGAEQSKEHLENMGSISNAVLVEKEEPPTQFDISFEPEGEIAEQSKEVDIHEIESKATTAVAGDSETIAEPPSSLFDISFPENAEEEEEGEKKEETHETEQVQEDKEEDQEMEDRDSIKDQKKNTEADMNVQSAEKIQENEQPSTLFDIAFDADQPPTLEADLNEENRSKEEKNNEVNPLMPFFSDEIEEEAQESYSEKQRKVQSNKTRHFDKWWEFMTEKEESENVTDHQRLNQAFYDIEKSISKERFLFVCQQIANYFEEKKWKGLPGAVRCLRNLLLILVSLFFSKSASKQKQAETLFRELLFDGERYYFYVLPKLLKIYNSNQFAQFQRDYLQDLLECTHHTMKLMELISQKSVIITLIKQSKRNVAVEADDDREAVSIDTREQSIFILETYIRSYAHPKIVNNLLFIFAKYSENSKNMNHFLAKLMYRICFEPRVEHIFFKLNVFRQLQKFLSDPIANTINCKELKDMAVYITRQFHAKAMAEPVLFVEILLGNTLRDWKRLFDYQKDENELEELLHGKSDEEDEDFQVPLRNATKKGANPTEKGGKLNKNQVRIQVNDKTEIATWKLENEKELDREWTIDEDAELLAIFSDFADCFANESPFILIQSMIESRIAESSFTEAQVAYRLVKLQKYTFQKVFELSPELFEIEKAPEPAEKVTAEFSDESDEEFKLFVASNKESQETDAQPLRKLKKNKESSKTANKSKSNQLSGSDDEFNEKSSRRKPKTRDSAVKKTSRSTENSTKSKKPVPVRRTRRSSQVLEESESEEEITFSSDSSSEEEAVSEWKNVSVDILEQEYKAKKEREKEEKRKEREEKRLKKKAIADKIKEQKLLEKKKLQEAAKLEREKAKKEKEKEKERESQKQKGKSPNKKNKSPGGKRSNSKSPTKNKKSTDRKSNPKGRKLRKLSSRDSTTSSDGDVEVDENLARFMNESKKAKQSNSKRPSTDSDPFSEQKKGNLKKRSRTSWVETFSPEQPKKKRQRVLESESESSEEEILFELEPEEPTLPPIAKDVSDDEILMELELSDGESEPFDKRKPPPGSLLLELNEEEEIDENDNNLNHKPQNLTTASKAGVSTYSRLKRKAEV